MAEENLENKPDIPAASKTKGLSKLELSPSVAILAAGALIAGSIIFIHFMPTQPVVAEGNNSLPPSVDITKPSADDHIIGSPDAPIVLVEYSDFQCPYCNMVYPTLKRLTQESGGQIAWVYRQLPLESIHPQARPAALASECIAEQLGNDGFWKFADTVFANQSKMSPAYYTQLAAQFGADSVKFASCVSSQKYASKIDAQASEAEQNGGTGTPFTVVVGKGLEVPVSGALPYAQFAAVIKAINERQ
jgi:protein-disulfide isomerase